MAAAPGRFRVGDRYCDSVVLLAEAVATMPWLVTLMELMTRPAGSLGMPKVYDCAMAVPPRSDARPARPVRLPTSTVIWFEPAVCTIFPVAPPREELSAIASGPAAGSGPAVRPGTGTRLLTVANETTTVPLIWLIVAPLNDELTCTPVALAVRLLMTTWWTVKLLALLSIALMARVATSGRKGNPWIVIDGLLPLADADWILLASAFCANALPPNSAATSNTRITTSTTPNPIRLRPRRRLRGGLGREPGCP